MARAGWRLTGACRGGGAGGSQPWVGKDLGPDEDFVALGVDSVESMEVVAEINRQLSIHASTQIMLQVKTLREVTARVLRELPASMPSLSRVASTHNIAPAGQVHTPLPPPPVHDIVRVMADISAIMQGYLVAAGDTMDMDQSFDDLGFNSIDGMEIVSEINAKFGTKVMLCVCWKCALRCAPISTWHDVHGSWQRAFLLIERWLAHPTIPRCR